MSDLFHVVLVAGASVERVRAALVRELVSGRSWQAVVDPIAGARRAVLGRSENGVVVVNLDPSWSHEERDLARSVARHCEAEAASLFYSSAGEIESGALFAKDASVASFIQSDAAGSWEVTAGERVVYRREWQEEESEVVHDAALAELEAAKLSVLKGHALGELMCGQAWHERVAIVDAQPIELAFLDPKEAGLIARVEAAVASTLEPLFKEIGFVRIEVEGAAADEVGVAFARLIENRKGEACELIVRYDFSAYGAREWGGWQNAGGLSFSTGRDFGEFRPQRGPAQLTKMCRFMAASIAKHRQNFVRFAPSLEPELVCVSASETWRRAEADYDVLWRTRLIARERGPSRVPANVVFRGSGMIVVETAAKERFTFKFDTARVPASEAIAVGGVWEDWAGNPRARELEIGGRVLVFDEEGALVQEKS